MAARRMEIAATIASDLAPLAALKFAEDLGAEGAAQAPAAKPKREPPPALVNAGGDRHGDVRDDEALYRVLHKYREADDG